MFYENFCESDIWVIYEPHLGLLARSMYLLPGPCSAVLAQKRGPCPNCMASHDAPPSSSSRSSVALGQKPISFGDWPACLQELTMHALSAFALERRKDLLAGRQAEIWHGSCNKYAAFDYVARDKITSDYNVTSDIDYNITSDVDLWRSVRSLYKSSVASVHTFLTAYEMQKYVSDILPLLCHYGWKGSRWRERTVSDRQICGCIALPCSMK